MSTNFTPWFLVITSGSKVPFGVQGAHTTASRGCYSLTVGFICAIAHGKYPWNIDFGSPGHDLQVTLLVHIELPFKNTGIGFMANGDKKPGHI